MSEQEVFISSEVQSSAEDQDTDKKHANKSHPLQQLSYFADTWSILRFIKGTKSQGVQISPDGRCSITIKNILSNSTFVYLL